MATEIIGKQVEFGVATESSRGTPETVADKWARKAELSLVEQASHAMDNTTRGMLEDGEGRRKVSSFVEGDVSGILHADVLGWFLANIYGVVTTSTLSGSVKSHAFSLGQNIQHPSLTFFAKDGDVQQIAVSNGMISKLAISAAIEEYVRYTASLQGAEAEDNTDTPDYDTEYDFVSRDITVKIADTEAGLAGATALKLKNLNLTFEQPIIRDHVEGSYIADDIYNAGLKITGDFVKNFADETFKDLFLGDDSVYMQIVIEGEADLGGGYKPKIAVVLNKVQVTAWTKAGGTNDLVTETVGFQAFLNSTDEEQSTTTIQNLTSSYVNVPSA